MGLSKKEEKAVRDEKMLYEAYLDLYYSVEDFHYIAEMQQEIMVDARDALRGAKKKMKRADANLLKAEERYMRVTGRKPSSPGR